MKRWLRKWLGLDLIIADVSRFDRILMSQHYQMQIYLADKINTDETKKEIKRIADIMESQV